MNYLQIIIITILSFLTGFIISALIFNRKSKENALILLLNDFKRTIEEYKNQNQTNTREVQNAIEKASELTNILTTNQNLKGQFGEDCLEAILKVCYPQENINYIKQFDTTNEDDKKIKPDYLINLPNQKSILIDCKLNLEKFIEYQKEKSQAEKQEFIKDLNSTINNLSNKKYQTSSNIIQPDFILMYIPLEPVLTHIYTDKDFISVIKNANEKNIIIVGNSSILTTIRLTKLLWAQNRSEENIENIVNIAENIYEIIAKHSQNLYQLKKTFDENQTLLNKEYENLIKNSKLFKNIELLREYGIKAKTKRMGKKLDEIKIHQNFLQ